MAQKIIDALKKNDFGSEGGGQECISYRGPKFDMGF
jgi:hypothetical protein